MSSKAISRQRCRRRSDSSLLAASASRRLPAGRSDAVEEEEEELQPRRLTSFHCRSARSLAFDRLRCVSYAPRLDSSMIVSKAATSRRNAFAEFGSPVTSGCSCRAFRRYARRISSRVAVLSHPTISYRSSRLMSMSSSEAMHNGRLCNLEHAASGCLAYCHGRAEWPRECQACGRRIGARKAGAKRQHKIAAMPDRRPMHDLSAREHK